MTKLKRKTAKSQADPFDKPICAPDLLMLTLLHIDYSQQPDAREAIIEAAVDWPRWQLLEKVVKFAEQHKIDTSSESGGIILAFELAAKYVPGCQIFDRSALYCQAGRPKGSAKISDLDLLNAVLDEKKKEDMSVAQACRRLTRRRFKGGEKNPFYGEKPRSLATKFSRMKCHRPKLDEDDPFVKFARKAAKAAVQAKLTN